jgi:hypothetical protein
MRDASGGSLLALAGQLLVSRTISRTAKITEIRPELTPLRSWGDAALSRVSPDEPWVRLTSGLNLVNGGRVEPILSLPGPLGPLLFSISYRGDMEGPSFGSSVVPV